MREKAMVNAERNRRRQLLILIALLGFVGWYVFLPTQLLFALLFGGDYRAPTLGVQPTGTLSLCPRETHNCVSTAEDPIGGANEYFGAHWIYRDGSTMEEAVSELVDVIKTTRPSNFMPKVTQRRNDYVRAEYTSRFLGFVDDLEVYFPAASRPRTVDYRSASRVGDRYASTIAQDEHKSRIPQPPHSTPHATVDPHAPPVVELPTCSPSPDKTRSFARDPTATSASIVSDSRSSSTR